MSFHEKFGESVISSNNKGVSLLEIVGPNVDGNHVKVVITDVYVSLKVLIPINWLINPRIFM